MNTVIGDLAIQSDVRHAGIGAPRALTWKGWIGDNGMEDAASPTTTIECPYCSEPVNAKSRKCKHCGEILDPQMREIEMLKRQGTSQVFMNAGGGAAAAAVGSDAAANGAPQKSRVTAAILAFLLGGLGFHKFYLGQPGWGLLYLVFCWTLIPSIVGFIEGILYLMSSDIAFKRKYG